jgi:hypothetical protein
MGPGKIKNLVKEFLGECKNFKWFRFNKRKSL